MKLQELLRSIEDYEISGDSAVDVSALNYDSRRVSPGSLFVAIRGTKTDGHRFIPQALANGAGVLVTDFNEEMEDPGVPVIRTHDPRRALARLAECFYGYPARKVKMIGITGTNGKTTTSYMIGEILRAGGMVPGIIGTLQIVIGDETLPTQITTPESLELQKYLSMMVAENVKVAVMEVSSHALHFNRVGGIQFYGGIFTNLTQDHLDFHSDMDSYFQAKLKLFKMLIPADMGGFAVLNSDDPRTPEIIKALDVPFLTFGLENPADLMARDVKMDYNGNSFTVAGRDFNLPVTTRMSGIFNVYNALSAIGAGRMMGFSDEQIAGGIGNLQGVRGRFEAVDEGQDFGVVVDYAHTPDGLERLMASARRLTDGRLIVVFGCGGDRDRTKRPIMGEKVAQVADVVIVTSDNPRSEEPRQIIGDIIPGVEKFKSSYVAEVDRKTAILMAVETAEPGDLVVIAGKGHETYQILKDRTVDFDDVKVAREAIAERVKTRVF